MVINTKKTFLFKQNLQSQYIIQFTEIINLSTITLCCKALLNIHEVLLFKKSPSITNKLTPSLDKER